MIQHKTVIGSSQLHALRLCFNDQNCVITNEVEVKPYSCFCWPCRTGGVCAKDWPDNEWSRTRLELKNNAILDVPEDDEDRVPA